MRSLPIRLSNKIDDDLNDIARRHGMEKTEVIKMAFALIAIADKHWMKQNGTSLGIVRENGKELEAVGRVVGDLPMSTENANLHDEAAKGYLKEILVFDEMERLRLARQVLCGIFVISVGVFTAHAYWDQSEPIRQMFELLKIGALPLVTLVISFYFPNTSAR